MQQDAASGADGSANLRPRLILASASPRRLALLRQAGIVPDAVLSPDVDETPRPNELPPRLALRLARAKAEVASMTSGEGACVLAADTVVAVGRRILPKAEDTAVAERCLQLLSGRGHRVYTACCVKGADGRFRDRVVETRVTFKRLSPEEIARYLASGEWRGKAGGYAIQERAGTFVIRLVGSYPAVVGLPLYEAVSLLEGAGYPVRGRWHAADQEGAPCPG